MGLVIFSTQNIFSQTRFIPKDSLRADLDTLITSIKDIHPNMFARISEKEFYRKADSIKSKIDKDLTATNFYLLTATLVASLGDGHTHLYPPLKEFLKTKPLLFPYQVKIDENDSIIKVVSGYGIKDNKIPENAIITGINGIPAKKLVGKMMKYCSGERYFFKLVHVNHYFKFLLQAMFKDSVYHIDYQYQNSKKSTVVHAVPYPVIEAATQKTEEDKPGTTHYSFDLDQERDYGIIHFRSFNHLERFKRFLKTVFTVMKEENVGHLIIDIRKNYGGDSSLGDELFQYISHVPFRQFGKVIVKTSERQKEYYIKHYAADWSKKELRNFKKRKNGISTFDSDKLKELEKNDLRYHGKVYLLISHNTFSSAASFSWAFKYFKMGTVIGEETGGMAVSFGDVIYVQLPHSKLNCSVSHKKFYLYGASEDDIHGTLADYEVEEDRALDYALQLIEKDNRQKNTTLPAHQTGELKK